MNRRAPILAAATLLAALAVVTAAQAAGPGAARALAVRSGVARARGFAPRQVIVKFSGGRRGQAVGLPPSVGVRRAAMTLSHNPRVAYAAPNYIATASAAPSSPSGEDLPNASVGSPSSEDLPNDPGSLFDPTAPPGGWVSKQWNFLPWEGESTPLLPTSPGGIDAVGAWRNLIAAGHPGAAGITVAVLDTGIAYRAKGSRFRRSPDFSPGQFAKGYDFVENDPLPLDENGHGTHVAGTIAEKTNNGIGLTGLAYRAKLMPVRVLDRNGSGKATDIANGIRFAVDHGADVINMSFNFGCGKRVPEINEELHRAYRAGVVTVASIGNLGSEVCVAPPATGPRVIGVGGTTEGGCLGSYSLTGEKIDVVAPGGGPPVPGCPSVSAQPIYQVTLKDGGTRRFGEPDEYVGTSMAAAHVSGVAAMILAAGVLNPNASPEARVALVTQRLRETSRSIGLPSTQQGAGLIDAARATAPGPQP